jgi:HK97 family phage prohead protease
MRHKTAPLAELVTVNGVTESSDEGYCEALVAAYNNTDKQGDRLLPGCFTDTLAKWRASGKNIPVILAHEWSDPFGFVGYADPFDVRDTREGLLVAGSIDTDTPTGKQVHRLMRRKVLTSFSFGYNVPPGGETRQGWRERSLCRRALRGWSVPGRGERPRTTASSQERAAPSSRARRLRPAER